MSDSHTIGYIRSVAIQGRKTDELNLLLECAQLRPRAEIEALFDEYEPNRFDWAYFLDTATRHGVVQLVHQSIRSVNSRLLPDVIKDETRRTFHMWGLQVHLIIKELTALLDLFSENGIRTMLFKGPALSAYAFGDASLRKPGDLDILVLKGSFAKARELLVGRGYRPKVSAEREADFLKARNGVTFFGECCNVDLHWTLEEERFDTYPLVLGLDPGHVWERRVQVEVGGNEVAILGPEDHLLFLCGHGTKHSWSRLYLVADVAELIRSHGGDIEWGNVLERAGRYGNYRIVALSLLLAADLLSAPLPPDIRRHAYADPKVLALAAQVGRWLFDPRRNGTGPSELEQHVFRLSSRERLVHRATYVLFRAQRAYAQRFRLRRAKTADKGGGAEAGRP